MNYSTGWKRGSWGGIRQCLNYRVKKPYHYTPPSTIIRKGIKLEDGSMLWQDYGTGRLYVEKANSNVAQ
jgi:hypothetical protein